MSRGKLVIAGALYAVILGGLVAADYAFTSSATLLPEYAKNSLPPDPDQGVRVLKPVHIDGVFAEMEITTKETDEKSLVSRIIPETIPIRTQVLLQGDDRLGLFSSVEAPDVRAYFFGLKDALQASFSSEVTGIVDTTEAPEGKPVRNVLSFMDPALSEEKLIFVRVRERLYEIHVAAGKGDAVQALIEKLTE
jgi:hypothetical protein